MSSLEAPTFCKLFFSDHLTRLRIPTKFGKKHEGILPRITLLESTDLVMSWDVKIARLDDHFVITDGWPKFVKDSHLTETDLLVFYLVTNQPSLQVAVYGADGCPKQPYAPSSDNPHPHPTRGEAAGQASQRRKVNGAKQMPSKEKCHENSEDQSRIKSFIGPAIRKGSRYFMGIPKEFAKETGIINKSSITLQNLQGKGQWPVKIVIARDGMRKGWNDFRIANKLGLGDECKFVFDSKSGNLILQNDVEKESVISSAKKGKGRAPNINAEQEVAKRGRGRPRKVNIEQQTSNVPINSVINNDNDCEGEVSDNVLEIIDAFHSDESHETGDSMVERSKSPEDGAPAQVPDCNPEEENPLYFETVLKLYNKHKLSLPRDFWEAAELSGKENVGLEYLPTNCYKVVALNRTNLDPNLMDMTSGWPEFKNANGMVVGGKYSFEFERSKNVIQVNQVKKSTVESTEESSEN